jgi:hypothetical protein
MLAIVDHSAKLDYGAAFTIPRLITMELKP